MAKPHEQFKRDMLDQARGTPFEQMFHDNPDAVDSAARMMDAVANPLDHFVCAVADCGIRFGIARKDWKFMEQVGESVYCPRGHENHLRFDPPTPE